MAILRVKTISKSFSTESGQPVQAIDQASFHLEKGQILCLLGPSGCGKTTLLRMIAGLESPDSGTIVFDGQNMAHIPPHKRNFSMMFQEFALFPHMNVFDNIAFGLRMRHQSPDQIRKQTHDILALMDLTAHAHRNISQLSGGERQRVALARSLVYQPQLLLLDEPLGSLDRILRDRLIQEIRNILKQVHVTAIFVTHDQTEAFAIADVIAVMDRGKILQIAPPESLYKHPANPWIARFLGFENILECQLDAEGNVRTDIGTFIISLQGQLPQDHLFLLIRPEAAHLAGTDDGPSMGEASWPMVTGIVTQSIFKGQVYQIRMTTIHHRQLVFDLPNTPKPPDPGQNIRVRLNPEAIVALAPYGCVS